MFKLITGQGALLVNNPASAWPEPSVSEGEGLGGTGRETLAVVEQSGCARANLGLCRSHVLSAVLLVSCVYLFSTGWKLPDRMCRGRGLRGLVGRKRGAF